MGKKPSPKNVCAMCGALKAEGMMTAEGRQFCNQECASGYKKKRKK